MAMYEGYHGTKLSAARRIITTRNIHKSTGDRHWLGDGAYFFLNVRWVPWWWDAKKLPSDNRGCVKCNITVSEQFLWDIDSEEGQEKLDLAYDLFEAYSHRVGHFIQRSDVSDGMAINYLASKDNIKVVKGTFRFRPRESPLSKLLGNQVQLSVRDERCLSEITLWTVC